MTTKSKYGGRSTAWAQKRTSAAKAAAGFGVIYGTAEAVPLSKTLKLTHYFVFSFGRDDASFGRATITATPRTKATQILRLRRRMTTKQLNEGDGVGCVGGGG